MPCLTELLLPDLSFVALSSGHMPEKMAEKAAKLAITGITADSRAVRPGFLFVAVPGLKSDGREFIPQALEKGAAAILIPAGSVEILAGRFDIPTTIPVLQSETPRQALSLMAARFYGRQPGRIVAVTGTNGKTSIVVFARQIWQALGVRGASMGTIGVSAPGFEDRVRLTTADPVGLQAVLKDLAEAGYDHVAMEASSHGLHQHRLDGVKVSTAAFTNLTQDHLDYHPDMTAYLEAKGRLFSELLLPGGLALLNIDDPASTRLAEICRDAGRVPLFYGEAEGADLRALDVTPTARGQSFRLQLPERFGGGEYSVELPLIGAFQLHNVLAALGLVLAEDGLDRARSVRALSALEGAPGRLQPAGMLGGRDGAEPALVLVDYAHTPDALENVLRALRPHCSGKLVCVAGCGGDRDRGKRPKMAHIGASLSDFLIITDDNPRSEDPAAIRADMLAGLAGEDNAELRARTLECGDRREAIAAGLDRLQPGDVLVLAGKGHENGQIVGDVILPFDDRMVAQELLLARGGSTAGGDYRDG